MIYSDPPPPALPGASREAPEPSGRPTYVLGTATNIIPSIFDGCEQLGRLSCAGSGLLAVASGSRSSQGQEPRGRVPGPNKVHSAPVCCTRAIDHGTRGTPRHQPWPNTHRIMFISVANILRDRPGCSGASLETPGGAGRGGSLYIKDSSGSLFKKKCLYHHWFRIFL